MKNILIFSPHFPTPDLFDSLEQDPRSKFLLNYAIEWVSEGHSVTVVHSIQKYPFLLNIILGASSKLFKSLTRFKQNSKSVLANKYEYDQVKVVREPVIKFIPHSRLSDYRLRKLAKNIHVNLDGPINSFDFIFFDYVSPSLDLMNYFNFKSDSGIFTIFHQTDEKYLSENFYYYKPLLDKCTGTIFRNESAKEKFSGKFGLNKNSYLMYSGIPNDQSFGDVKRQVKKFLYVGRIIESKNIQDFIFAISKLPSTMRSDISFEIVGDGEYKSTLISLVHKLNLSEFIFFTPKISHSQVFEKMNSCDAFVMVSKETFGMVYVEALSQGCLVIAAENEGIDGVIKHKKNGFLATIKDVDQLSELTQYLILLEPYEVEIISNEAIETAKNMRERSLAKDFIQQIL